MEQSAGVNVAAKESSKLEECQAICRLRGVAPNAPIALQLKAIDEEYKSLLESGQSGRADHVQGLYVWRSKNALKVREARYIFYFPFTGKLAQLFTEQRCV